MSTTASNVRTISVVWKIFISVDERLFWTYLKDGLGTGNDCYVGRVRDDSHIELLGVLTERYEAFDEVS